MRHLLLLLCLISSLSCRKFVWDNPNDTINSSTEPASLKNGLVAYYPFNGNANDESGNGNNGDVIGATLVPDRYGKQNNAYRFDGINDFIDIKYSASLNLTSGTISVWVNRESQFNSQKVIFAQPQGRPQLVASSDVQVNPTAFRIQWKALFRSGQPSQFPGINSASVPVAGDWVNVIANFTQNSFSIYINGVLQFNNSTTLEQDDCSRSNFQIGGFNPNVGGCEIQLGNSQMFLGKIDDIRIYNRALTQEEITYLANN